MQSAAALLQYPLGLPMPVNIKTNDLSYYEPRTRSNGFFTGDSIYSIAWLALGNARAALKQWDAAFNHIDTRHFFLFREKLSGGALFYPLVARLCYELGVVTPLCSGCRAQQLHHWSGWLLAEHSARLGRGACRS